MRGQPPKLVDDRRDRLLKMLAEGRSVSYCARELGVSRTTVYNTRDRDPLFAEDLAAARLRATGRPVCPSCRAGELRFVLDPVGAECCVCAALFRLAPVTTALTVYEITTDLARMPLADTA